MNEVVKRGPGRPARQELKKGNSSWKPASVTDVAGKDPNYRYRWCHKDPDNLASKDAEGWETVTGLMSDQVEPVENNRMDEGKKMTSVYEKRDVILKRIPEEIAQQRDAYYNNESARRVAGLTAHIKKEAGKEGAEVHGDITVTSRQV